MTIERTESTSPNQAQVWRTYATISTGITLLFAAMPAFTTWYLVTFRNLQRPWPPVHTEYYGDPSVETVFDIGFTGLFILCLFGWILNLWFSLKFIQGWSKYVGWLYLTAFQWAVCWLVLMKFYWVVD